MSEVIGRYSLISRIATGGMAEIWKARIEGPANFEKICAVKRMLPHLIDREDGALVDMFIAEAKLAAMLVHPNIVQVFDFGQTQGEYFIAMEYVAGQSLGRLLRRLHRMERSLPTPCALYIVAEAARGLAHAHDQRDAGGEPLDTVHRDVSPQNLLLSYSGEAKVADFGIAKVANAVTRTQSGAVRGKIAYMSPEQARGEPLDRRTDLFSLGLVLFEGLAGRAFFSAEPDAAKYRDILGFEALHSARLEGVAKETRGILGVALQPMMRNRFQDGATFAAALTLALGSEVAGVRQALADLMLEVFADELAEERRSDVRKSGAIDPGRTAASRPRTPVPGSPSTPVTGTPRLSPPSPDVLAMAHEASEALPGGAAFDPSAVAAVAPLVVRRVRARPAGVLSHWKAVTSIAVCPAERIVSGCEDGALHVWDQVGRRELRSLTGHVKPVSSVSATTDGSRVVSASRDGTVRVWRVSDGAPLATFPGHVGEVRGVAISGDGWRAVSVGADKSVRVWDLVRVKAGAVLVGHRDIVTSVALGAGDQVATGSFDGTIGLWDLRTNRLVAMLQGGGGAVLAVTFSPDGSRLLAGCADGTMRFFESRAGAQPVVHEGHTEPLSSVAVSPDGMFVASGSRDSTVRVREFGSGRERAILEGHRDAVLTVAFASSSLLLSGSADRTIAAWDLQGL